MTSPQPPDLPINAVLPALRDALASHNQLILVAPPGAGKSTGVPPALLGAGWLGQQKIMMLEPRRLATRAVASRIAQLAGEPVGGLAGYRMRMERRTSERTRIEVVTEGMLTRSLQGDPALEGVGCVIFDEYHERNLQADLGLALVLDIQQHLRPELRIVLMSATLDTAGLGALLPAAAVVRAEGRSWPVETRYLERSPAGEPLPRLVTGAVLRALASEAGDLLVFLPGTGEIRRVHGALEQALAGQRVRVLPLYGDLSQDEQDRALRPDPGGCRRVVLATNIAETSLTIEGISVVVDSGFERRPRFDPRSGMSRLDTLRISQGSAEQRRGRAGRLGPGSCLRLWTEAEQRRLAPQAPAEIREADLAPLALELACWGSDAAALRWLDPPPAAGLGQARELLQRLGALDAGDRITSHGREMARLGTHPRLAHMLLLGRQAGLAGTAAAIAALLGERALLREAPGRRDADLRSRLMLLQSGAGADLDRNALRAVRRSREFYLRQLRADDGGIDADAAGRLLALAYPDRIARWRGAGGGRYQLSGGRGAFFGEAQALSASEFLVVADLDDADREARIFLAAPLTGGEIAALAGGRIRAVESVAWDARKRAVLSRRQRWLDALLLADEPLPSPDRGQVRAALLAGIRELGLAALPWQRESQVLRARIALAGQLEPEQGWPAVSDADLLAGLEDWLAPWLDGMSRASHLARLDLAAALRGLLQWEQQRQLDGLLPTHVTVPSGSRIAIDYLDEEPSLAVRLQEVFGLTDTPRIGNGRLPLLMKLLSPARRPVQLTRDLASFWAGTYHEVRRELKGRYPRHYWPEDPRQAEATRGVRPR